MGKLIFDAQELRRIVEHSIGRAQSPQIVDFDVKTGKAITKPLDEPSVVLVHDQGVYLMSNAVEGDPIDPATAGTGYYRRYVVYAKGCDPHKDKDWYCNADSKVGGDDFAEQLPWARTIKRMIDGGAKEIIVTYGARNIKLEAR